MSNNINVNCTNVNKIYLDYPIYLSLKMVRMDGFNTCIFKDFNINKYKDLINYIELQAVSLIFELMVAISWSAVVLFLPLDIVTASSQV